MTAPDPRPSLVFGIVAATGTRIDPFVDVFSALLRKYGYEPASIRLTDLLLEHAIEPGSIAWKDEGARIEKLMTAGDLLREKLERGDAMALLGALGIAVKRREVGPTKACAFVVRQLKHPEEVSTLRRIYGDRLFVLALYSTYSERLSHLTGLRNIERGAAERLMSRDEEDVRNPWGQRTRDTFELGDVFFRIDENASAQVQEEAERFLDLLFGRPDMSPRLHEHAMYLAYAASFRSADLSRQVGATLTNQHGDILGVGANDVPAPQGGPYWPGKGDRRDHALGSDSNNEHKLKIARDVFERTQPQNLENPAAYDVFLHALSDSLLFDITEYGRAVHAEMDAVLSCARTGAATRGARLFCTTFPCHNCAKHLVDAGIVEVQYVEAYPKSMASRLHSDAIYWEEEADPVSTPAGKVVFKHYVGIGPRRYMDLFSLKLSSGRRVKRKGKDGDLPVGSRDCRTSGTVREGEHRS
ncbi:MAG TPA: anti-phage dCTP deaminase [Kofleriaceae bacterium]|nr:anti-phage dCTP deaminase [Kofleriaceae bacterium]